MKPRITPERVPEALEAAARLICSEPGLPADSTPNSICYFKGDDYGRPFWMRHLTAARQVMALAFAPPPVPENPGDNDGQHPLERRLGGYAGWLTHCLEGTFQLGHTAPRFTQAMRDDMLLAAAALKEQTEDADRFRALMRCGRIKMQGSSGVDPDTGERNGNNVHFGAEFWPEPLPEEYRLEHPDSTSMYDRNTKWGRACLRALADAILEEEARAAAVWPAGAPATAEPGAR